jgi:hypothetical protein
MGKKIGEYDRCSNTGIFFFWFFAKNASPKVFCGKVHCHKAKAICLGKDLVFFNECSTVRYKTYRLNVWVTVLKERICKG